MITRPLREKVALDVTAKPDGAVREKVGEYTGAVPELLIMKETVDCLPTPIWETTGETETCDSGSVTAKATGNAWLWLSPNTSLNVTVSVPE